MSLPRLGLIPVLPSYKVTSFSIRYNVFYSLILLFIPTTLSNLTQWIPRASVTFFLTLCVSYQILVFDIEKTFNNDCIRSVVSFIFFSACIIKNLKGNHIISTQRLEVQNSQLLCHLILLNDNKSIQASIFLMGCFIKV